MTVFDSEFSNKTHYGLETAAQRYTWAGYYLFVILSSLIGDTTILVASIKYRAIKLHRVIVTIIQHIAVSDMLVIALQVLPIFVTLLADEWVFGDFLCKVVVIATYHINAASLLLICAMTTSKVLLFKYPLRFGSTSSKKAHFMFCGACWGIALVLPVSMLAVDMEDVYFSYVIYVCAYNFTSDIWVYLRTSLGVLLGFLPMCLIVATSVYLLIIAKRFTSRGRGSLNWQGVMTTIVTATMFCVSLLPFLVIMAIEGSIESARIAKSLLYLNTMCNFYTYCLTVTSFRNFVRSRLQILIRKLTFPVTRGRFYPAV